jgi:hypothetical protein
LYQEQREGREGERGNKNKRGKRVEIRRKTRTRKGRAGINAKWEQQMGIGKGEGMLGKSVLIR